MPDSIYTPEMLALTRWLRTHREGQGLSMREMGQRLSKPHTYVQKIETGERRLDLVEFVWYCHALGVSPHDGVALVMSTSIGYVPKGKVIGDAVIPYKGKT